MIRRQFGRDRGAGRRRVRLEDLADRARRNRRRRHRRRRSGRGGMEFARRGDEGGVRCCAAAGLGSSGFGSYFGCCAAAAARAPSAPAQPVRPSAWRGIGMRRRGRRRGAHRAQIALDHRETIDDMAERVVDGLQQILRAAVGLGLAEADVGQLALDEIDHAGIGGRRRAAALGQRGIGRPAAAPGGAGCRAARPRRGSNCRRADRRWPRSAPADRRPAARDARRSKRESLPTCMRSKRSDSARIALSRCSVLSAGLRPLARFQRGGERRDALLQHRKAVAAGRTERVTWSTLDDSSCTSSESRASASLEATLETMPRSAEIAPSSWRTVEGSSLARRIRSSLAPRLRIASS